MDKKIVEYKSEHHLITKSNALIESARIKFSAMQQRVIHTALSQIFKGDRLSDQVMYKIPISAIADLAGRDASGEFYRATKSAARSLVTSLITIKEHPNGSKREKVLQCAIVQAVEYDDTNGTLWIRFSHDAIPYLSGLEGLGFTQYSLEAGLLYMDSAYAYRLHDLIARWGDLGTKEISVEDFRWMMGIDDNKYPRFNNFRARVIDPAIEQVNKHSRYDVKVGYRKSMRRVVSLQFAFRPKPTTPAPKPISPTLEGKSENSQPENDFIIGCAFYKVNRKTVQAALDQYGLSACTDILNFVKSEIQNRQTGHRAIENPGAYLAECLRNGVGIITEDQKEAIEKQSMEPWQHAGYPSKEEYDTAM
ncbi:MAG: replication initiation protein, partial [Candidatus Brocadiales bacterium]|nr:replication initiation protein [Candidatus Brocadiales bacterium]